MTKDHDLIDRQVVLALPRNIERNKFGEVVEETINVVHVKKIPSVDAVPCNFCRFTPPSMEDGKPCGVCPAEGKV